jgi:hypothetical protein
MPNVNRAELQPPRNRRPSSLRRQPEVGAGRLGIISGFFQLSGIGATLQTIALIVATVFPRILPSQFPRPWLMLGASALLAFGFFRTSHLLDQRRRSGAQLATLCFLTSLAGGFAKHWGPETFIGIGVSAIGLCLVGSVWKYLEN